MLIKRILHMEVFLGQLVNVRNTNSKDGLDANIKN